MKFLKHDVHLSLADKGDVMLWPDFFCQILYPDNVGIVMNRDQLDLAHGNKQETEYLLTILNFVKLVTHSCPFGAGAGEAILETLGQKVFVSHDKIYRQEIARCLSDQPKFIGQEGTFSP